MSAPTIVTVSRSFAQIAAGTSEVWYWTCPHPGTYRVKKAYFTPMSAVTANDTNYTDLSIEVEGTEIASEQTTTSDLGSLTAGTPVVMALTGTGKSLEISQGDTIAFKKTDSGLGVAVDGSFELALEKVRT